jgi:hypothetical protein
MRDEPEAGTCFQHKMRHKKNAHSDLRNSPVTMMIVQERLEDL